MKTAARLSSLRQQHGISQLEISKWFSNKNAQFVSNIERGKCSMPPHWIPTLSKKFSVRKEEWVELMLEDYRERLIKRMKKR